MTRLPICVFDRTGVGLAGATFSAGEVTTSVDGAPLSAAAGSVTEVGFGVYTYIPTAAELSGRLLTLRVAKSSYQPWIYTVSLPLTGDLKTSATAPDSYVPIVVVDSNNIPLTGRVPASGELLVSKDGGGWTNAVGTWLELGSGLYYYVPTASELGTPGLLMVMCRISWPYVWEAQVAAPETFDPYLSDPLPVADADLAVDRETARQTPISVRVNNPFNQRFNVWLKFANSEQGRVVYDSVVGFLPPFNHALSSYVGGRLTVLQAGGWQDAPEWLAINGNGSTSLFTLRPGAAGSDAPPHT